MVTWDNYEEYMMMHADGELQPQEELALQVFLDENSQLKGEMALYAQTKLVPDHSQVYAQKESLLKPIKENKVIPFTIWRTYAVAAGVAAIIVLSVFTFINKTDNANPQQIVKTDNPVKYPATAHEMDTMQQPHSVVAIADEPKGQQISPVAQLQAPAAQHAKYTATVKRVEMVKHAGNNVQELRATALAAIQPQQLNELPTSGVRLPQAEKISLNAIPVANTMADLASENDANKRTWIDKLPIDDLKKNSISNTAGVLAKGFQQVANIKETISDEGVSFKIEKRKLLISF